MPHTAPKNLTRMAAYILAALALLFAASTARANTYTVTKTAMGGSSTGRLDTAINSANSNPGPDTISFNIPTSDSGYDATRGVWRITLSAALPALTGDVTIDGTTQTTNQGNKNTALLGSSGTVGADALSLAQVNGPEIEIVGSAATFTALQVTGGSLTLKSVALLKLGTAVSVESTAGASNLITGCVFGVRANTTTPVTGEDLQNALYVGATTTITGAIIAYAANQGVNATASLTIQDSQLFNNYMSATGNTGSPGGTILRNLIYNNKGQGLLLSAGSFSVLNNTIRNNGLGGTSSYAGITAQGGSHTVDRNLIYSNYGSGVQVTSPAAAVITRNSIYANGTITNSNGDPATGQVGIQNVPTTRGASTPPFYSVNDSGDTDAGGNGVLNYPVITSATVSGSNLTLAGYARPGSTIELFVADPDATGYGEGKTYLTTLTEGSGSDADSTTGTYSGTINGVNQGADATNRFSFTIATPSGVAPGTALTSTATVGSATSEFGGNVTATQTYSVSGRVLDGAGAAVAGVTLTVTGSASTTTATDAAGNYTITGLAGGGSYTVTPSKTGYRFSPTSRSYASLAANQTSQDYTATYGISIGGTVQDGAGAGMSGVTVTLSGGAAAATTTDASGNYSFAGLTPGTTYVVSPSKTYYTFTPTQRTLASPNSDVAAMNFTGALATYTISGHVRLGGAGLSGVTVTLSGSQSATTTTAADGSYSFSVQAGGTYTVTPSKTNYTFAPGSLTYNAISANQSGADFNATAVTYSITGRVTTSSGSPVAGVTIAYSGSAFGSAVTDASGYYTISGQQPGGNYTLTPSKNYYTFAPANLTITGLSGNQTGADFTATRTTYTISGRVMTGRGVGITGATVTLSGGAAATATTDAAGAYSFAGLPAGDSFTVAAAKNGHTLTPPSRSYVNLLSNASAADFTSACAITGTVTFGDGTPLASAAVTLTGPDFSETVYADPTTGTYYVSGLMTGEAYQVSASLAGYAFDPAAYSFGSVHAGDNWAAFSATRVHAVNGHVWDQDGNPLAGVLVIIDGYNVPAAETDEAGYYSFANIAEGASFTVIPSKEGVSFSPASYSVVSIDEEKEFNFSAGPTAQPNVTLANSETHSSGPVSPGTEITYTTSFVNTGDRAAANLVILEPVPAHCDFKVGSAAANTGSSGLSAVVTYSSDGGETWGYVPQSAGGGAPPGYDRLVTHIRFAFSGALPSNSSSASNSGSLSFSVVIR